LAKKPIRINVNQLRIGMYVCGLDRPWQQTPFPIHGLYIRDLTEVKQLCIHCQHVFIDTVKGIAPITVESKEVPKKTVSYRGKLAPMQPNAAIKLSVESLKKELPIAQKIYNALLAEVDLVMTQASNQCLKTVKRLHELSHQMVDSVVRNPDAFVWLVRVRKMQGLPYYYVVRSALWAVLLGRHLGLSKGDLRVVAASIFFKDIGKFQLDKVQRAKLDASEVGTLIDADIGQTVIQATISLLRGFADIHPKIFKTIKMHYERLNGSGFPDGLQGDDIFLLAKITAIASFYDEVTYPQGAKCALPASRSVSRLYAIRGIEFQDDLVVEFIKAIGLYPTGTLVELSTNQVAVVTEQNYERRLKPKLLVLLDAQGQLLKKYLALDLYEDDQQKQALMDAGKKLNAEKIDIITDLELYQYPISVEDVRDWHIAKQTKKSFFSFFSSR
jgi:response regulator RpfG family c-di-GMP phosphodiesterase